MLFMKVFFIDMKRIMIEELGESDEYKERINLGKNKK